MATLAQGAAARSGRDSFFFYAALAMAAVMVAGFSFQLAMGRSTFAAPWIVHAHGLIFFGWVTLYTTQATLMATGARRLHRTLGLVAFAWIPLMVIMGFAITWFVVREDRAPPFFDTREFLIGNPLSVLCFAALAFCALARRGNSPWHKRLMFCAMASITGPGFGRLLPAPFMIPVAWTVVAFAAPLVFPIAGMIADKRRDGRVHPAYLWAVGAITATHLVAQLIAYSPVGTALARAVIAGTPTAERSLAAHFP